MPRRSILSATERTSLLSMPQAEDDLIRLYTFSDSDLALIRQRRGDANRLGWAVQLCLLRFPGQGLLTDTDVPMQLVRWVGQQLRIAPTCWERYAQRKPTRREHLLELRAYLGTVPFGQTSSSHLLNLNAWEVTDERNGNARRIRTGGAAA